MKVIISTLLAVFCLTYCNTSRKENPKEQAVQKPLLEMGCYAYHKNGDTINFKINQEDDNITGTLKIAYAEKDANKGTFKGILNGDTLMGTYTFKSEGRRSEREIAFLIKGNQLIEGYGKMTENGTAFRDKNSIKFPPTMPLTKVDCTE